MRENTQTEDGVMERLSLFKAAKDLFLSDWYDEVADKVLGVEYRDVLQQIQDESREEIEETVPLIRRWSRIPPEHLGTGPNEIARLARDDFLRILIEAKEAAGRVYEKAARLAPPEERDDFLRLADVDFRHALQLRRMLARELVQEVQAQPSGGRT